MTSRGAWLRALEHSLAEDQSGNELATALVVLASVAGQEVQIDEDEEHGASRRALLLLTAGGDPDRGLDLNGRAVRRARRGGPHRRPAARARSRARRAEGRGEGPCARLRGAHGTARHARCGVARICLFVARRGARAASYCPAGAAPVRRPLVALLDRLQLFLCAHSDGTLEPAASREDPPAAEDRGRCPRTRGSCSW